MTKQHIIDETELRDIAARINALTIRGVQDCEHVYMVAQVLNRVASRDLDSELGNARTRIAALERALDDGSIK